MMDEALYEQNPNNFAPVMDQESEEYISKMKIAKDIRIRYLHRYELNEDFRPQTEAE